jgi:hypothetical protein
MRKGPVVAALLAIVGGIYFQVRGNSSKVLADSTSAGYLTKNSTAKSVEELIGTRPRVGEPLGSPSLLSQVTGSPSIGTHPIQHRVTLTWQPSEVSVTGGEIIGYNVYRGSGIRTKFAKLNTDPLDTAEYVDDHVRSGHTYYYAATAVNQSGRQSRPSNLVRVVVPFP